MLYLLLSANGNIIIWLLTGSECDIRTHNGCQLWLFLLTSLVVLMDFCLYVKSTTFCIKPSFRGKYNSPPPILFPTLITVLYLAGPHWGDEISVILKHIEDLKDATRVSEHWDAGVWYGQVQSEVIYGLQSSSLLKQHKDHYTVSKPWQPACSITHTQSNISNYTSKKLHLFTHD